MCIPPVWQAFPPLLLPPCHGIDWRRILFRRRSRLFVLKGITSLTNAAAVVEEVVMVVVVVVVVAKMLVVVVIAAVVAAASVTVV